MLKLNQLLPVGTENLSQRQRGSVPQPFYFDGLLNMAAGADACMWAPTRRCRAPRRLSQPAADNHLKTGDLDHLIASRTPPLFFNPAPPQVSIIRRAKTARRRDRGRAGTLPYAADSSFSRRASWAATTGLSFQAKWRITLRETVSFSSGCRSKATYCLLI